MFKRIHFNSPVVLGFAGIALISLLLGLLTRDYTTSVFFSVYRSSPTDPFTYLRMLLYIFGHANFEHFFGNMSIILLIGPMLEEKYGSYAMGGCILITALATGLIHIILEPSIHLLGASGIVFMMILMSSFANFKKGQIPLTLIVIALLYLGQEIYSGLFVRDNVSQMAHIAGGIIGAGLGYWINVMRHPDKNDGNSGSGSPSIASSTDI